MTTEREAMRDKIDETLEEAYNAEEVARIALDSGQDRAARSMFSEAEYCMNKAELLDQQAIARWGKDWDRGL